MNSFFQKLWYNADVNGKTTPSENLKQKFKLNFMKILLQKIIEKISHWLLFMSLCFLSLVYRAIIFIRKEAYDLGLLKSYKATVPVIVVGNLTVGGTGKTPLIIALVDILKRAGFRPGIVSRGYGGKSKIYPLLVTEKTKPQEAGDEPVLLAARTQCPVVVAPKRIEAIQYLEKFNHCNIILSDDGLQHFTMQRDVEIIVIDGDRRFGNGFCLPAGPLREPVSRCNTVDFLITNVANTEKNSGCPVENPLQTHDTGSCELPVKHEREYSMTVLPEKFIQVGVKKSFSLDFFDGKSVHAVTGIGNPKRFFESLQALGVQCDMDDRRIFEDHHVFVISDLKFKESKPIIMTEKDAVKCHYLKENVNNKNDAVINTMYYLKVSAQLDENFKRVFLEKIKKLR